jgi:hypothetical protein
MNKVTLVKTLQLGGDQIQEMRCSENTFRELRVFRVANQVFSSIRSGADGGAKRLTHIF